MNIKPRLAAVAPRVSADSGASFPVVDLLGDLLDSRRSLNVAICGERSWGKSVAIAHLAATFPDHEDLQLWDSDGPSLATLSKARIKVFACRNKSEALSLGADCWMLSEWGLDEALEYLMACHRSECARLMPKLRSHSLIGVFPHRPVLWCKLLDLMANDESIPTVQAALDKIICTLEEPAMADVASAESNSKRTRLDFAELVLRPLAKAILLEDDIAQSRVLEPLSESGLSQYEGKFVSQAIRLISEEAIFVSVALNGFLDELTERKTPQFLTSKLTARAIEMVARRVAKAPILLEKLNELVAKDSQCQSMGASVLCCALLNWRPNHPLSSLRHGRFDGVSWDGVLIRSESHATDCAIASVSGASFCGASLNGASLPGCFTIGTDFSKAHLSGADLSRIGGREANFSKAVLRRANFNYATLWKTKFALADCTEANFENAKLQDADLSDACFLSANLTEARLRGAKLEGTDFTRADFSRAIGIDLDFRQSVLFEACFHGAKLRDSNFEGQSLPMVDFIGTDLAGANFSNTIIENGSFFGANLLNARLGDINWENCDLRNADLRGATFHYGSTRSGLVGSPYPSHGTRTGFYTDDYYDQPFKAPEEIRIANLRGADLRGARLSNVDFYLVDLRDARLDRSQIEHVRQCGAILATRV